MALTAPRTWIPDEVVTAAMLNEQIRDNLNWLVGDASWIAPALTNGWVNFGSANFSTAGYRKLGDVVYLKGTVKSGTLGAAIFTLPVGYRPPNQCVFGIESNNLIGRVDVNAAGTVYTGTPASATYVSLEGAVFSTV